MTPIIKKKSHDEGITAAKRILFVLLHQFVTKTTDNE